VNRIDRFSGEYRFLSNFWYALVELDGEEYPSVEHAYQAAKTLDLTARKQFQNPNMRPGEAKGRGKVLELRPNWDEMKVPIMKDLVLQKFTRHPALKGALLATGDAELVEGNYWHDQFWGRCICHGCHDFPGQNQLGKILMDVRANLKEADDLFSGSDTGLVDF
jgi:ribA/ribD-fused uncharacterized protein